MNKLTEFFEQERGKRIKNLIIGVGASVVLIGALAKLEHWAFASTALIVGMSTEAFIFCLLGVLPPHKDYYWEKLSQGGDPESQQCGWLKDKFGLSWQIVPKVLPKLLNDPDPAKSQRAMNAMLQMKKLNIDELRRAFEG